MTSSPSTNTSVDTRPSIPYTPLRLDQSNAHYAHGPDSTRQPDVPRGTTVEFTLNDSNAYPGTSRKFWVHVPALYDPAEPAALLVFLDGGFHLHLAGDIQAAVVLDNLVHHGDLPPTIGLFIDPGVRDADGQPNRDAEYDAFDDRFANFLVDEVIPLVSSRYPVTDDPDQWGITGGSGGGNGAFTAAWMRPDKFRRVYCSLPDFASMPGGDPYPAAIPATPKKALRVLIQAGHRDLRWNEPDCNLFAHALRVTAALAESGYDFRLVLGDGAHDANHAGVLLPDALRWLWREEPK